jgi:hypothetical protein
MKGVPKVVTLGMSLLTCLAMAATPAQAPAPGIRDVKPFVTAVHSGQVDPETYDFEAAGFFKLAPTERMQWQALMFDALGLFGPQVLPECSAVRQQNGGVMAWTQIATQSRDAADWKANAGALRARLVELDKELKASAPAKPSADPLVQELLVRFTRDQDVREKIFSQKRWVDGLPKVAADNWMLASLTRMTAIDCDNTDWLKQQLPKVGWFTIPKYGEEADAAAWHLVQHADRDPPFQREMLARLQALPPGQTDGKRLGFLYDRVARAEGRPQRYGTQGICKDGTWDPNPIEDPEHLDERRALLGMKPEAEAIANNTSQCTRH